MRLTRLDALDAPVVQLIESIFDSHVSLGCVGHRVAVFAARTRMR